MHPAYLRQKARVLRREKKLTIDQLADRLALPRTTIYYWVKDLPLARQPSPALTPGRARGNAAMQAKWRRLRRAAYEQGGSTFASLCAEPTFRDFVVLYVAEGHKRNRNEVSLGNSDPAVVALATRWMRRLGSRKVAFSLQYHVDQDVAELRRFWGGVVEVDPEAISLQRKSNSGQLRGRTWRSRHGVLTVRCCDTYLHARLQAWMDLLRHGWLDSA